MSGGYIGLERKAVTEADTARHVRRIRTAVALRRVSACTADLADAVQSGSRLDEARQRLHLAIQELRGAIA